MSRSLSATKPRPPTYVLEVFQGNTAFGAFRSLNKSLADTVVHVLLEALLASRQLSEPPLCRLCAN